MAKESQADSARSNQSDWPAQVIDSRGHYPWLSPRGVIDRCRQWEGLHTEVLVRPQGAEAQELRNIIPMLQVTATCEGRDGDVKLFKKCWLALNAAKPGPFERIDLRRNTPSHARPLMDATWAMYRMWQRAADHLLVAYAGRLSDRFDSAPVLDDVDLRLLRAMTNGCALVGLIELATATKLNRNSVGPRVNALIEAGVLERPRGIKGGCRLTAFGRKLVENHPRP